MGTGNLTRQRLLLQHIQSRLDERRALVREEVTRAVPGSLDATVTRALSTTFWPNAYSPYKRSQFALEKLAGDLAVSLKRARSFGPVESDSLDRMAWVMGCDSIRESVVEVHGSFALAGLPYSHSFAGMEQGLQFAVKYAPKTSPQLRAELSTCQLSKLACAKASMEAADSQKEFRASGKVCLLLNAFTIGPLNKSMVTAALGSFVVRVSNRSDPFVMGEGHMDDWRIAGIRPVEIPPDASAGDKAERSRST